MKFFILALMGSAVLSAAPVLGETGSVLYSADKRFIDHGDKTISDSKTGLMWMKEDSFLHQGHWLNWFEAFDYVNQLNKEGFANYFDWQVPTIQELSTLYEPEKFNSSQVGQEMKIHIDPIFAMEGSGSLWAAETNGRYNAFGVVFNTGMRFNSSKKSRSRRAVRAVRYINLERQPTTSESPLP